MSTNASPELCPNRYDALVALAVVLLAAVLGARFWFAPAGGGALTVVVSANGQELERAALADYAGGVYESNGCTLTVAVADGAVSVAESDCPNQDCVHSGAIGRAGQSLVCLPARVVIELVGGADYDLVTG